MVKKIGKAVAFLYRRRAQIICIVLGFSVFAFSKKYMKSGEEIIEGDFVKREGYGAYDRSYEVYVKGLDKEEIKIEVPVSHREYSDAEIEKVFALSMEYLAENILNGNPSLQEVSSDLELTGFIKEYGIRVSYISQDPELLDTFGTVYNEDLQEAKDTALQISLTDKVHHADYIMNIRIVPKRYSQSDLRIKNFRNLLEKLDKETVYEEGYTLPSNWEGRILSYREESAKEHNVIWIIGFVAAALLYVKDLMAEKDGRELRNKQMLVDYPEIVSKLMVFIGAGLSIRSAWENIVNDYEREGVKRYAYEEMAVSLGKLKTGTHEAKVYRDFGRRCAVKQYMKLASLLEQNRKTGLSNLGSILGTETANAWAERINMARRAGEEAGTKLLVPLFIMLGVVLAMVMIPAMLAFK